MPGFTQRFAIQKVLLLEVDLRQMLCALLDLHTTGRAGGIASAVVVQREAQFLGGIKQGGVSWHGSASASGRKKPPQRHPGASFNARLPPAQPAGTDSAVA